MPHRRYSNNRIKHTPHQMRGIPRKLTITSFFADAVQANTSRNNTVLYTRRRDDALPQWLTITPHSRLALGEYRVRRRGICCLANPSNVAGGRSTRRAVKNKTAMWPEHAPQAAKRNLLRQRRLDPASCCRLHCMPRTTSGFRDTRNQIKGT